jgi:hypothetical protein
MKIHQELVKIRESQKANTNPPSEPNQIVNSK